MNMNRIHRWYCRSSHWRRIVRDRLLPWALAGVDLGDRLLEIGPGPGLTTDILRTRVPAMTAVEVDTDLAHRLSRRMCRTNVTVIAGDATRLPLADASVSAVVCFTMLHHVPSAALQDRLLAEVARVLAPGGTFAGSDSMTSWWFRQVHRGDTLVPVDPASFPARLTAAGFREAKVSVARGAFRFRARKPHACDAARNRIRAANDAGARQEAARSNPSPAARAFA